MLFPETKRVIYKINPLDRVVCQLSFPPILKIDTEPPAAFQDRIRSQYPNYSESVAEFSLEVGPGVEGPIAPELFKQVIHSTGNKNHQFTSQDSLWQINLTRTFIALTTTKYYRWEDFKANLNDYCIAPFTEIYRPASYTRIGLRYMNVIKRSALGLRDVAWNHLLQPYVLGVLGLPDFHDHIQNFKSTYEMRLSDQQSIIRLILQFVTSINDGEQSLLIDADYYCPSRIVIPEAQDKLDFLNSNASRLIRWCITDKLHEAMQPQPI